MSLGHSAPWVSDRAGCRWVKLYDDDVAMHHGAARRGFDSRHRAVTLGCSRWLCRLTPTTGREALRVRRPWLGPSTAGGRDGVPSARPLSATERSEHEQAGERDERHEDEAEGVAARG